VTGAGCELSDQSHAIDAINPKKQTPHTIGAAMRRRLRLANVSDA
jgi:hypothetical protein